MDVSGFCTPSFDRTGRQVIFAVDTHTMGEPTRVVISGYGRLDGTTLRARRDDMAARLDYVRTALLHEPRGHSDMFGAVIMEPTSPEADLAVLFMDGGGYLDMCGHGIIGATVAALELKLLKQPPAGGHLCIETPAGLVQVEVSGPDDREITFRNVPAFVEQRGVEVEVPGLGRVSADIAYGGNYFALVDAGALGFSLCAAELPRLCSLGMTLRQKLRRVCAPVHPLTGPRSIDLVEFHAPAHSPAAHGRNVVIFGEGQFDRSPCGTGTCARMASLYAEGLLGIDEPYMHESVIGTTFTGRLRGLIDMDGRAAVVPEITARAYVTGFQQFVIDADDPLKYGFKTSSADADQ